MTEGYDVVVDVEDQGLVAAIASPTWQLTVRGTPEELSRLDGVAAARWADRSALAAGRCAGAQVYWSTDDETGAVTALLSTTDDELWDVAIVMPAAVVTDLVRQLPAH